MTQKIFLDFTDPKKFLGSPVSKKNLGTKQLIWINETSNLSALFV